MALVASDIRFFFTGAGSAGGVQTNPNLSLGNFRSATEVRAVNSTFTSVASANTFQLTDITQIGQAHGGKWLLILGGNNATTFHAYIESFNTGTGVYNLQTRVPLSVAIGDAYQIFAAQALFDNVTAAQSAAGHTDYRCVAVRNVTGVTLNGLKHYIEFINPGFGLVRFDLAADDITGSDLAVPLSADEVTYPTMTNFYGVALGVFQGPFSYATSDQPLGGAVALGTNGTRMCWLRRVVPALSYKNPRCVVKLVVEATNTGGTPSPIRSACLLPYQITGLTPALTVSLDRIPRIAGGSRVRAVVTATETGAVVPDQDVYFDLTVGPGTVNPIRSETDATGLARSIYTSPVDPAQAGQPVTIRARTAGL